MDVDEIDVEVGLRWWFYPALYLSYVGYYISSLFASEERLARLEDWLGEHVIAKAIYAKVD